MVAVRGKGQGRLSDDSRAACYALLARGLASPQPGSLEIMQGLLATLDSTKDSRALTREISDIASGLEDAVNLPLDQLQGEHTGLFVNNHPHVPCPPYESAYRERTLMGNATASASAAYAEWDLEVHGEHADHAAAELEFMVFAIRLSQVDDGEDTRSAQQAFLHDHLLTWMPKFALDIQSAASVGIYRSLGRLLEILLATERSEQSAGARSARASIGAPAPTTL